MTPMQPMPGEYTIYDLEYPCYVGEIPENSARILHTPGQFEYDNFDKVFEFVVEAYKIGEYFEVFDIIPIGSWNKKIYRLSYQSRLAIIREMMVSEFSDKPLVTDWPATLVKNPAEMKKFLDYIKEEGFTSARVMSTSGEYVFGTSDNFECVELNLEGDL